VYIYIYCGDDKKVEWDMYAAIPYCRGSHDRYGYEKWKIILKISSVISPWHLNRNAALPKWSWLEKLIGGRTTTIDHVDLDLYYKIFVLSMLYTFLLHLRQITKSLMLSMSPSWRGHNSAIWSLNVRRSKLASAVF